MHLRGEKKDFWKCSKSAGLIQEWEMCQPSSSQHGHFCCIQELCGRRIMIFRTSSLHPNEVYPKPEAEAWTGCLPILQRGTLAFTDSLYRTQWSPSGCGTLLGLQTLLGPVQLITSIYPTMFQKEGWWSKGSGAEHNHCTFLWAGTEVGCSLIIRAPSCAAGEERTRGLWVQAGERYTATLTTSVVDLVSIAGCSVNWFITVLSMRNDWKGLEWPQ